MPSQVLARNHASKEEQIAVAFECMDRIARHARQSCQLGLGDVDETKHQRAVYLENGGRSDAATEAGWCWRSVSAEWLALMPGCIIAAASQPRRAGRGRFLIADPGRDSGRDSRAVTSQHRRRSLSISSSGSQGLKLPRHHRASAKLPRSTWRQQGPSPSPPRGSHLLANLRKRCLHRHRLRLTRLGRG